MRIRILRVGRGDGRSQFQAVDTLQQVVVENDDVDGRVLDGRKGEFRAWGLAHREVGSFEEVAREKAEFLIVVDDEHSMPVPGVGSRLGSAHLLKRSAAAA
jgi:hypothetical protein